MPITIDGTGTISGISVGGLDDSIITPSELASSTSVLFGARNKIINGAMDIAQRGTSLAAAGDATYLVDRWTIGYVTSAVVTVSQQSDVPSSNEFQNSLRVAITTADASIASTDVFSVIQKIEGFNVRDLIGRTFSLSFWVRSSKTGTHCVQFRNSVNNRSYVFEYTVSAANTWEYKTVTVNGGLITAGTWDWTNGNGLQVGFCLAAGTNFQTTAGAWQTGNFHATSNQVNCLDTIGNIFAITGVQLEVGSVATPFEHRLYGQELALCQRYYQRVLGSRIAGGGTSTTSVGFPIGIVVTMRGVPTFSGSVNSILRYDANSPSTAGATYSVVATNDSNVFLQVNGLTGISDNFMYYTNLNASSFSAEL